MVNTSFILGFIILIINVAKQHFRVIWLNKITDELYVGLKQDGYKYNDLELTVLHHNLSLFLDVRQFQ